MKKVITKVFAIALILAMVFTLGISAFAYCEPVKSVLVSNGYATGIVYVNGMAYACSGSTCGNTAGVYTSTTCAGTTLRYSQLGVTFITDICGYDGKSSSGSWTTSSYTGTVNSAMLYPTYPNNTTGIYAIGGTVGCCYDNTWLGTV